MAGRLWVIVSTVGGMEVMGVYTNLDEARKMIKDDKTAALGFLPNRFYREKGGFLMVTKDRPEQFEVDGQT